MPTIENSRLIAKCCGDIAGGLATAGLTVGGPMALPLLAFLGLNTAVHLYERRDREENADALKDLFNKLSNTLSGDLASLDGLMTEAYIGQQIEAEDLRQRLGFINEIVKQNQADNATAHDILQNIEQVLQQHPKHAQRLEHVLKRHHATLGGKLDVQQQGIVLTGLGNEVLYLQHDELKALQQQALNQLDALSGGQDVLYLQHETTHAQLAALKQLILAQSAALQPPAPAPEPLKKEELLDQVLTCLARDAERGVVTAHNALKNKDADEARDYFVQKLAALDQAKDVVDQRIAEEEVQLSRVASDLLAYTGRLEEAAHAIQRILKHLPEDLDATNRLGLVYSDIGDLDAATECFEKMPTLRAANDWWKAVALSNLGLIDEKRGDLEKAKSHHYAALRIHERMGDKRGMSAVWGNLASIAIQCGHIADAESLAQQALAITTIKGPKEWTASNFTVLGRVALHRGDFKEAEKWFRQSLEYHKLLGLPVRKAVDIGNLGMVALRRKDYESARNWSQYSLDLHEDVGNLAGQSLQLNNLGVIADRRGEQDAATQYYKRALVINRQLRNSAGMADCECNLGGISLDRGDLDHAQTHFERSLKLNRQMGRLNQTAILLGNLGLLAVKRNQPDKAQPLYREALGIYRQSENLEGQAECRDRLGQLAMEQDDHAAALIHFRAALEAITTLELPMQQIAMIEKLIDIARASENRTEVSRLNETILKIAQEQGLKQVEATVLANLGLTAEVHDNELALSFWTKSRDLFDQIGMPDMTDKIQRWIDSVSPAAG